MKGGLGIAFYVSCKIIVHANVIPPLRFVRHHYRAHRRLTGQEDDNAGNYPDGP